MSKSEDRLLARVNAVPVTADDLRAMVDASVEARRAAPEAVDGESSMFFAVRIAHNDGNRAFALWSRMAALALLMESDGLPGWTLPNRSDDGALFAQDVLLEAAAVHPLTQHGNNLVFERETFLTRVLALSESETQG